MHSEPELCLPCPAILSVKEISRFHFAKHMGMYHCHCQQHRYHRRCCRQHDTATSESQTAATAISKSYRHSLCNNIRKVAIKVVNERR